METGLHETTGENNLEETSKTASQLSMTTRLRCLKGIACLGSWFQSMMDQPHCFGPVMRQKHIMMGRAWRSRPLSSGQLGGERVKKGNQCQVASSNGSLCNSLKLSLVPHVKDFLFSLHPNGIRLEAKPSTLVLGKTAQIPTTVNLQKKLPHAKTYRQLCLQLSGWTWASAHGTWGSTMPEQTWDYTKAKTKTNRFSTQLRINKAKS